MQTARSVLSLAGACALAASFAGSSSCAANAPVGFDEDAGDIGDASGAGSLSGGNGDAGGNGSGSSSGGFGGGSSGSAVGGGTGGGSSDSGSGSGGFGGGSSGNGSSGTGSSDGGGSVATDSGSLPGTCAAAALPGAVALTSNYLTGATLGDGGYAYAYQDAMGSTACLAPTAFCGAGSTVTANATGTAWGAGIGVSLNQAMATGAASPPVEPYAVPTTATGIAYTLSALPAQGARLIIDDKGSEYCAPLSAASGTIPWASFNTACWNGSGSSLAGAPQQATHVQVEITASSAPGPFNVCVTAIAFAH